MESLHYAQSTHGVDAINKTFYGRIRYPWPPIGFDSIQEDWFWPAFIAQDLGRWGQSALPPDAAIWVAGCGTNQALITALRYPNARVLGTDLSAESLDVCRSNAKALGVENLTLECASLNDTDYRDRFDMVICTGVIHHNRDPAAVLDRLACALAPDGVMELMVYNTFHRILISAFQKALWILTGKPERADYDMELPLALSLTNALPPYWLVASTLNQFASAPEAAFADAALQPVEHNYTIESFDNLLASRGLEMLSFCVDPVSRSASALQWNLDLGSPELQSLFNGLPHVERWQVANLLMAERSPMIWFYVQHKESRHRRIDEHELCRSFLATPFRRVSIAGRRYPRRPDGSYDPTGVEISIPGLPPTGTDASRVYDAMDEAQPVSATLERLGLELSFHRLNALRVSLTTSAFPYLLAATGDRA